MKVQLIDCTVNPANLIAIGARVCYTNKDITEIAEGLTKEEALKFVNKIVDAKHMSVLEHVSFTFAVEGVSRIMTHQLVRHRLCTFHERSQRYVNMTKLGERIPVVEPLTVAQHPEAHEMFEKLNEMASEFLFKCMNEWNIPGEDARFGILQATESQLIMTCNAAQLIHILKLRTCNRAQWEIREFGFRCLAEARKVLPEVFNKVGPSCYTEGKCPEGKMTCGKMLEVQKEFTPEAE